MMRWLVLVLGLGLALAAAFSLWTAGSPENPCGSQTRADPESREPAAPAHATIREDSRRELEEILRQADAEGESD